jgi:arylsulfatase A-like enzyme
VRAAITAGLQATKRALTTGAAGGALLFAVLFVLELSSVSVAYMGQTDERTVDMLMARYARRLLTDQARLLALQLTVGALLGALGAALVRLHTAAHGRAPSRRARFAGGLALATFAHVWMLARHLVTYPQLYDEWLYQRGGARKALMVWATSHLSTRFLDALAFTVGAAFAAKLALSPRGGAAIARAVATLRALAARVAERIRTGLSRFAARRQNLAIAGAIVAAIALATSGMVLFGRGAPAPKRRPNILLIAVDSLRADRVFGAEGAARFPTLAGLAARGVRFREAHVTVPRTFPSFVTLLTGRWPHHHGIRHMFPTAAARAAIGPSLVSSLSASGYATSVVADYAGEIFSRTPFGFASVDVPHFDMTTILEQRGLTVHPHALPYATSAVGRRLFHSVDAMAERSDPALLADRAANALERLGRDARRDGGKPFFLTVFFSAAHFPYAAPAPFYKKFASPTYDGPFRYQKPPLANVTADDTPQVRALYDGAVAAVDDGLRRLLARLDALGLSDDTIVVLTADHGEHLYDAADLGMGHGDHLHGDAADHVPLVVVAPKARARDVDAIVRDVDVAPTLATLAGASLAKPDGVDLGPLLRGERDELGLDAFGETELWLTEEPAGVAARDRLPYPSVFQTTTVEPDDDIVLRPEWEATVVAGKQRSIRTRDWKLVYAPTRDGARLRLEDPRRPQAGDQAAARPDVVAALRVRLERWLRDDPLIELQNGFVVPRAATPAAKPPESTNASDRSHSTGGPVRLLDRLATAEIESSTPLADAWAAIPYPQKTVSPWCGLRGADAVRCVTVTLADADVARWPRRADDTARTAAPAFDPVWNRNRGVYEAKTALFLPAPASARFTLDGTPAAALTASVATLPGSPPVELRVEIDGRLLTTVTLTARDAGRWHPLHVALADGAAPRAIRLSARPLAPPSTRTPIAALFATPTLLPPPPPPQAKRPVNVITIVVDTLRADALPVMPRLSAYAARAAHFTQAITAATWTRPSVLSLLGGDYPTALGHGAEEMIPSDADRRRFYALAPKLLPRELAARGHEVRAIGNNFFLLGHPQIGLDLGFDEVSDVRHPTLDTPAITRAALAFLEEHARSGARPFFLHLHYDGPHWPYTASAEAQAKIALPPGFPRDSLARAYLAEAAASDAALGEVLDALDRLHLAESTVVVILGDHGEIFDAAHAHTVVAMDQPTLHHHGWSAYDEILRVPLVVAMPGTIPARRIDAQVRTIDIAPTIAALVGLPWPGDRRGRSLLPLARGDEGDERIAFVEGQNVRALRGKGLLYLRRSDGRLVVAGKPRRADEELYALGPDPTQHHDLATTQPAQLADARALFAREAPIPPEPPAALLHLRLAPDDRGHLLEGTVRARAGAQLAVRGLQHGEAAPLDARTVRFRLHGPGQLDLAVDPEDAALELTLRRDGTPVAPSQLLVGPFALPLLSGDAPIVLHAAVLPWLVAERAPVDGRRGDILVYRDLPTAASVAAATTEARARGESEVASMMRRWGYAK